MAPLIRVLPVEVANRIAAGEVVERPASIVKELVENALDAGATHLEIELEDGGTRLVCVTDDGDGMTAEDLALCTLSHATSKIGSVEDLFEVASFGFRGEALPSIASVAHLSITTRRADDELGAQLEVRGGEAEQPKPAGAPAGTRACVRNLFFNVPARRKFLKQERTELSHCLEAVTRLLLPEPDVSARVTHGGRKVLELSASEDLRARIRALFGPELAGKLIEIAGRDGDYRLGGFVGPPSLVKANTRLQYAFLNGRYIRDRAVMAAVRDAYRGLIMPRDHPVCFLTLDMRPSDVDVNVHPTKTEVRFRERDRVFRLVRQALRGALEAGDLARPLRVETSRAVGAGTGTGTGTTPVESWTRELFPKGVPDHAGATFAAEISPAPPPLVGDVPVVGSGCGGAPRAEGPESLADARFLQVHRSYVLAETPDGFRIIDQHALHERKLFEELLARVRDAAVETQELLIPEVVDLGAADTALLLDRREDLATFGVGLEPFGGGSLCVRCLPVSIAHLGGNEVLEDVLAILRAEGRRVDRETLLRESVASLACRAAVKFNDALPEAEIRALLRWHDAHPEAANCPHGRPVAIAISLRELETQFQRKK